ncbi:hypothetical protein B0H15DRAFT_853357 [Mycena belliarum]|uniref:DUF6699 domain-containing protein n=1 Tax=Mycena belliarum TaxID=1033014 RepID=A0AAD6TYG4_9AGAR|nr:hypothetical protein B0H15DRAFT_853357 [Mycena belliae]
MPVPTSYWLAQFPGEQDEAHAVQPSLAGASLAPPDPWAPLRHSRPLYATTELPAVDEELNLVGDAELRPICLHSALDPGSALALDVLRDPAHQFPPPAALSAPATTPISASMTLTCPRLPWRFGITSAPGGFVSAADVRAAVHSALSLPVTRSELLATPVVDRPVIAMACDERYTRIEDPGAAQKARERGIIRADFLFGSTQFVGLAAVPGAQHDNRPSRYTTHNTKKRVKDR